MAVPRRATIHSSSIGSAKTSSLPGALAITAGDASSAVPTTAPASSARAGSSRRSGWKTPKTRRSSVSSGSAASSVPIAVVAQPLAKAPAHVSAAKRFGVQRRALAPTRAIAGATAPMTTAASQRTSRARSRRASKLAARNRATPTSSPQASADTATMAVSGGTGRLSSATSTPGTPAQPMAGPQRRLAASATPVGSATTLHGASGSAIAPR